MLGLVIFVVIECLLLAVLAFGDVGFDHPGRFGLDFDDAIVLLVLFCGVLLGGVVYAARRRRWGWAALQLAIPIVVILISSMPPRPLDPREYQYLVGKSKVEVHNALAGRLQSVTGGRTSRGEEAPEIEGYDGMAVYYSKDGRVLSVEAR
jgi:hypothetical protein